MGPKHIEGTWEEVARRSEEFAGRRVRVTVLDDPSLTASREGGVGVDAIPGHLIDRNAVAYFAREADDGVTLEDVRAATSAIEDSMARVVIEEERAERS
jgi:hypothetical protein